MSAPEGWNAMLEPGEKILWQGAPVPGLGVRDVINGRFFFGLFFTGFAIIWTVSASTIGGRTGGFAAFALIGLFFILVGLFMAIGAPFVTAYRRRRTRYALTDRAALIAASVLGRSRFSRTPLGEMNALELDDDQPGTVTFKREIVISEYSTRGRTGMQRRRRSRSEKTTAFERIADARPVYRQLSELIARERPQ